MSSTLREASKDTLQVNEKTWHYYSLPLAENSWVISVGCPNR